MFHFVKRFGIINKTEYRSCCTSIARSHNVLTMKIAFLVPVSSTNPHCSWLISGFVQRRALIIITRRMTYVMWLIRLIVR